MVENLLTKAQKTAIIGIITRQCRRFLEFGKQRDNLFYEPYTQMRQKHTATSAVISGFAPGRFQIDGIEAVDLNYGLKDKLVQPELRCERGVFHIYSDGSDLKGKKLLERCKEMNENLELPPVFFLIIVNMSKSGNLRRIEICLPDKNGAIIKRECIYDSSDLAVVSA